MDRRDQDCYFYYYSTCLKGDECLFRHEPAALGCETICPHWQKRSCMNVHCNLRHMHLRKNRKLIPCYWENQPSGCRKPHCPFLHKYPRDHLAALPTHPLHPNQPILPSQPVLHNQPVHPSHLSHPIHPSLANHPSHSSLANHPNHSNLSSHPNHSSLPTHPNHPNHPNLTNHPSHQSHSSHPIMEPEKKEGEPQVGTSQAAMERGEWVRGCYEQSRENVQIKSVEAPAQGSERGGNNQGSGSQGSAASFDDGMRLY